MYGSLDISTSGLVAQHTRMNIISANMANQHTITNADGEYEPFRKRYALLAPGDPARGTSDGVHVTSIEQDNSPFIEKYEPNSKFADENGNVYYPNVNPVTETLDAMSVARAYEANIAAIEATKSMMTVAMRIIA